MPPVAIAVAAAAASSAVASSLTVAAFGSFYLGSAALGSALASGLAGFAVSRIGGSLIAQKPKRGGANVGSDLQTGIKQVVRLSADTYKLIYGRARVGGTLALAEGASIGNDSSGASQTGDNLFLHMIIIHAPHEVTQYEEEYLNNDLVTLDSNGFVQEQPYNKDGKSYVRIKHYYGTPAQTADPDLVSEVSSWTTAHRLRGIAYTYIRFQWDNEIFTSGIPTYNTVIKGKKVYDPRQVDTDYGLVTESTDELLDDGLVTSSVTIFSDDGLVTESTTNGYTWTDNAALIINDYLKSRDNFNVPYGFGAIDDEVNNDYTISAANICDELVTKLNSTTMKRYTINGAIDTSATPIDNLENMITAMAGAVTYSKGKFRIHAGAYDTPEPDVVDETWLSGKIRSTNRVSRSDLFNAVRGKFINPSNGWQQDDFPEIVSLDYEAQDNNERIYTDIELPYTTDPESAQRLARITQRKGREQITVDMNCNYKALKFAVWDVIKVTNATRLWSEKPFRVIEHSFDITGGVTMKLKEENASSYDWSASDGEVIAAAPDTNLPSPSIVQVPTGVAYSSRGVDTAGGDQLFNLVLQWDTHSNAFVRNGGQFEIQFKLAADSEWRPSFYVSGLLTSSDIVSSSVNIAYDLRIRAINYLGRSSNWVTMENAIVGSSGGVGTTIDWGEWVSSPSTSADWGSFTASPTTTNDWGYYT